MKNTMCLFALVLILSACSSEPKSIDYSRDQCAYCMMSISDQRFGAELVTDKGRILKYDAAECMVAHLTDDAPPYQSLLAVPYDMPGTLVSVHDLNFLISTDYPSPMGANLAAFHSESNVPEKYRSNLIDWETLGVTLRN